MLAQGGGGGREDAIEYFQMYVYIYMQDSKLTLKKFLEVLGEIGCVPPKVEKAIQNMQ